MIHPMERMHHIHSYALVSDGNVSAPGFDPFDLAPPPFYANDFAPNNNNQDTRPNKVRGNLDDVTPFNPDQRTVPSYHHYANMNQFGHQSSAPTSSNYVSSSKTRIRWTQDLHHRFVDCVNRLGGPYKARPKAILQMMDTEAVTIFHVKSHLQKYRNVKYVPESVEGRSDKKTSSDKAAKIDIETGIQIKEALELQLDVQKRLHEQLEIQRSLQLRIEEQGKKLKMMLDQQQNLMEPTNSSSKSTVDDPDFVIREGSDDNGFPIKTD